MARKTPMSTLCDENEDTVYKITPSLAKTVELSDEDKIREINRNSSIAGVSDSRANLETTSSELAVHTCSSSKKRHIILSSDSDSEDNEKESVSRTPGFNKLNKCDAHVTNVKRSLHEDFRKNKEEGEWNKVISERDLKGDGDSICMREIHVGGTSNNNCHGAALISSSQKRQSTRSNRNTSITVVSDSHDDLLETTSSELTVHSCLKKQGKKRHIILSSDSDSEDNEMESVGRTCQDNGTAASAEKLKKSKALEELTERRPSSKGARSRLSSKLVDDDDNKGSLHKLEQDQAEEEQSGREDEHNLGSDSDLSDFIVADSSQSQELDVTSFKKLSQEQCFEGYLQIILSGIVNDEFLSSLEKDKVPYFEEAKTSIQGLIQTKKNAVVGKWKQFKKMLDDYTFIESIPLPGKIKNAKCEACNLIRDLSEIIAFFDEENGIKVTPPVKTFKVGCYCAERGQIYHELHHLDFEWKEKCIEKITQVKAANPGIEDDAEIVEHCMSDGEWLEDLYGRFQSLFGVADDYGPGGRKRRAMEQYCIGF